MYQEAIERFLRAIKGKETWTPKEIEGLFTRCMWALEDADEEEHKKECPQPPSYSEAGQREKEREVEETIAEIRKGLRRRDE